MFEMLNRQLSSSSSSKQKQKQKPSPPPPRSPLRLQDPNVNAISGTSSSSVSSSMSIDAPKGCLRFFLSNSSASKTATASKSAPNSKRSSSRSGKSLKENLPNPKKNRQWQSGKKPISNTARKHTDLSSNSKRYQQQEKKCMTRSTIMVDKSHKPPVLRNFHQLATDLAAGAHSTPVGKLVSMPVLNCKFDDKPVEEDHAATATTTTPPVQASVSPEIRCGGGESASALMVSAATPPCYGAGHHVSGVSDRRKCRARGILTVGQEDSSNQKPDLFQNLCDDKQESGESRASLLPLPAEASMRWLLSPCDEEDQKGDPENSAGSSILHSVSCPTSGHKISSVDLCNNFENISITSTSRRRTRITLLSPAGNLSFQSFSGASNSQMASYWSPVSPRATPTSGVDILQDQRKPNRYAVAVDGENSPLYIDSLGSGNVIQTPQSDSSSSSHGGMSSLYNGSYNKKHELGSEMDSVAGVLRRTSLSAWTWNNDSSCTLNSSIDDMSVSQCQMRISWRDGLVSRICEVDEFDCCRCWSDDEIDPSECGNFKPCPSNELNVNDRMTSIFSDSFGSPGVVGNELIKADGGKEKFSLLGCNSSAESICTDGDGGGLITSRDSDWTVCYKNHLFDL